MTTLQDGAPGADRRAQIERTLATYPHLDSERLDDLVAWFRNEATALDVAMVASNQAITDPYRRFRAEHLDGLTGGDYLRGLLFAAGVAAIVLLIIWRAL